MARSSDRWQQYAEEGATIDPLDIRARTAAQYTTSPQGTTTLGDYSSWTAPTHARAPRPSGGARIIPFGQGGGAGAGGAARGSGGGVSAHQQAKQRAFDFEKEWRASDDRVARNRAQYEGTQPWSGSPQDYEDVVGPNRSGGIDTVVNGPRQVGLYRDDDDEGLGGVPAQPSGGGNDGSGGVAATVPIGGSW
jgi:hypothetical protein